MNQPLPGMERAIELAAENVSMGLGGPFGAVIVRNGRIVAEGVNLVTAQNDPTAHAEIVAIRRACQITGHFELKDCELYSSCEPCPMCLGAAYWTRIGRLYFAATRDDAAAYGFDDSMIYNEIAADLSRRAIPTRNVMREEGMAPFLLWQQSPTKILY